MAKIYIETTDTTITVNGPSSLLPLPGQTIGTINCVLASATATVDLSQLSAAAADKVTVSLLKDSTAYTYVADAVTGMVKIMDGTTAVATLPVASNLTTTNVQFTNGITEIAVNGTTGAATIGTPAGAGSVPASVISAAQDGVTSDASKADNIYTFVAGTYTYNIVGFGARDVLDFPAGNTVGVANSSYIDGVVDLNWSYGGNTVTVNLTGISTANDAQLNSFENFNTVFGAGTII